jgi:anti-anti-sigma regulatory factor
METVVKEFKHCDVIEIKGRVDSSTAPQLTHTLNKITSDGQFQTCPGYDCA